MCCNQIMKIRWNYILLSLVVMASGLLAAGCGIVSEKKDESFITFKEMPSTYYSSTLYIYPDSTAVLERKGKNVLEVYEVEVSSETKYNLRGLKAYKDTRDFQPIDNWDGATLVVEKDAAKNFWSLRGTSVNVEKSERQYHPYAKVYSNAHSIHDKFAKERRAVEKGNGEGVEPKPVDEPIVAEADMVPTRPDYSSGRTEGSLNEFTPKNYNQFVQYYLGLIFVVMVVIEVILIIMVNHGGAFDHIGWRRRFNGVFGLTFSIVLIVTLFEVDLFMVNPRVLLESDFPLFGSFGRVLFFLSLCICQTYLIRKLLYAIEDRYDVEPMRYKWIFTVLGWAFALFGISQAINILWGDGLKTSGGPFLLSVGLLVGVGLLRLICTAVRAGKLTLIMIVFYLIIYPLWFLQIVVGGAAALLAKIAREKPDNIYEKSDDPDHRYATDVFGNSVFLSRLGDNNWTDNQGNMYQSSGDSFSRLSDNRTFR